MKLSVITNSLFHNFFNTFALHTEKQRLIIVKKNKISYLLITSIALLSACSTKLDVTGKYKETMVVYGLLDQSKDIQYIKVNKAFLGQASADTIAHKYKDSTQYVNSLNVKLKRLSDGTEFNLSPINTIPKDAGTFYSPDQTNAIYSLNTPLVFHSNPSDSINSVLLPNSDYQLIINNNETATRVSSQTSLISDAAITSPVSGTPFFTIIFSNNDNYVFPVRWNSGQNAKIYQVTIRLNYIDSTSTNNVTQKLDWVFPEQTTQGLGGGEQMQNDFVGQGFMKFVGGQLTNYSGLIARRALNVDIILISGGNELNTYIEVNKPSTSIVQEKPQYSNITNGLGIFSSRYNKPPFSRPMAGHTWDTLACGQYTRNLKFLDHAGLVCQ